MNRRLVLTIVLLVLGAAAFWLYRTNRPTTLARPLSDFVVEDTARVDRIFIADKEGRSIDLRRTPQGWTVNGRFMARQHEVGVLLRTFKRVEVRTPVPKSAEATVLKFMGAGAKKVEIYQGGRKPAKTWIVGHATKDHFGTYMLLENEEGRSSVPFVVGMTGFTGILNTRFHTELDIWRDNPVYRYKDLYQLAALEVEQPERRNNRYRAEQLEDGRVRLLDGNGRALPMDTVFVKGLFLPFQEFNYEYIERSLKPASRDSLLATAPNFILRTTERNGATATAKFWYMPYVGEEPEFGKSKPLHDNLRMRALIQDTLLVVVQRQYTDRILQPVEALMP